MHISIFNKFGAKNSVPVFKAFTQGLSQLGISYSNHNMDADIAVIWSVVWAGRMRENQAVWQHYRSQNRPVIVLEVGMLQRGHTWKMGINGTGITNYPAAEFQKNRASLLGIHLQPWHDSGSNIIIALQRPDSEQWSTQPPTDRWLTDTINVLRQHSQREIVIRPHPRSRIPTVNGVIIQSPGLLKGTYDDFDFIPCINDAWAVINWNSGLGSQSVISGIPAFVGSSSLAAPVANLDLTQIENPVTPDRTQWLEQLVHTEWTIPEIQTGYPLKRLLGM